MSNENDILRRRNLALEEKCLAFDFPGADSHDLGRRRLMTAAKAKVSQSVDVSSSEKWLADEIPKGQSVSTLRTRLRNVSRDNVVIRAENDELRKKNRHNLIVERAATEHLNRIKSLTTEYRKVAKAYELEKDLTDRLQHEVMGLRRDRSQLEESENMLKSERATLVQRVSKLQQQVVEVCEDKKNVEKLTRFIEKHSPDSPQKIEWSSAKHRDVADFSEPPKHSRRPRSPVSKLKHQQQQPAKVGMDGAQVMMGAFSGGGKKLGSFNTLMSTIGDDNAAMKMTKLAPSPKWQ